MAKENYITIAVSDTTNAVFNDFVRAKGRKRLAMNDVLEFFMLGEG